MNKLKSVLVAVAVFVSLAPMASAQGIGQSPSATPPSVKAEVQNVGNTIGTIRQKVQQDSKTTKEALLRESQVLRQNVQTQTETIRAGLQNTLKTIDSNTNLAPDAAKEAILRAREEARVNIQNKIEGAKQTITENKEQFRVKLEATKEEAKQLIKSQKTDLRKRLKIVQDERKQNIVLKVSDQLESLNGKYTDHLTSVLNNIEVILQGIISRTEKAAVDGKDVSAVRTAIASAQSAIAAAKSYVAAQAGTTYKIEITSENALKDNISASRKALRDDLQIVKNAVHDAREAVAKAASTLGRIQGVNNLKIETESE